MPRDRDLLRGLFLVGVALLFGVQALGLPMGRITRAGPGMFPLAVSGLLLLVGLATVVRSRFVAGRAMEFNVRNAGLILASLLLFAVLSRFAGMAAGIVALVFCASLAAPPASLRRSAAISAVLVAIAFAFQRLFGLDLHLFGGALAGLLGASS